jgi:DNA-binding GntR family transcriptional regulator
MKSSNLGDWLPELELAKRFGVSRSHVREALQALEKEGTVITEAQRFVAKCRLLFGEKNLYTRI